MRAWQVTELGEPADVLSEVDIELPELTGSQLRVRTLAAAANFPDVLMCRGLYQVKPDLPFPVSTSLNGIQAISATSWADIPSMTPVTLTLPAPAWVTISLGTWLSAPSGEIRVSSRVTGATTLGETQLEVGGPVAWGQVAYTRSTTGTVQASSVRTVRLNAGTNTITARAYVGLTGVKDVRYTCLQVSPIRWA